MKNPQKKIQFPKKLFITGTDTEIGKTVVSALLTLKLNANYWKPIQSGIPPFAESTDTEQVKKLTELPGYHFYPEKALLKQPLSPHLSAKLENQSLSLSDFTLPIALPPNSPKSRENAPLIIEGCGGLLVPINEKGEYIIDLIKKWNIPSIIVSRSSLGTINHTLLTIEQFKKHNLSIFGVILNGKKNKENKIAIEKFGEVPVIGEIEPLKTINKATLNSIKIHSKNY